MRILRNLGQTIRATGKPNQGDRWQERFRKHKAKKPEDGVTNHPVGPTRQVHRSVDAFHSELGHFIP